MAEKSGFFDAHLVNGEYDRVYLAENFAKYFASFIGNGIFGGKSNELMVQQKETADMSIKVLSGQAWINGYWYENSDELSLTIDVADGVLNRIDAIVLRWDNSERVIRLVVKKGTPATNASAPVIQRNADLYELKLAQVNVKAGTTRITQANITDTRLNSDVCGLVIGVVQQLDSEEFGIQLQSYIANFIAENDAWKNATRVEVEQWVSDISTSYTNWFNQFKVDCNTAVSNLLAENQTRVDNFINDNQTRLDDVIENFERIIVENDNGSLAVNVDKALNENALATQTLGYTKKNMIPYPFTINGTNVSGFIPSGGIGLETNGITWTDNGDGTIEANGEATADSYFTLYQGKMFEPGRYLITSGYPSTPTAYVYLRRVSKETGERVGDVYRSYEENVVIEITKEDIELYDVIVNAIIVKDTTAGKVLFAPMIRRKEISDDTWEPYEKSVKERLDEVAIEDPDEPGCFYRINKQTGAKEWVNPPLRPGWWYPLTERWEGKPVHQVTIYASSLPVNSAMVIQAPANWNQIVSINAFAYDEDDLTYYPFPIILHSQITPLAVVSRVEGDGSLVITTNGDASRFKAVFIIKYLRE